MFKKDFKIAAQAASGEGLIIRAMIWDSATMAYQRSSFGREQLERIFEIDNKYGGMQMKSGLRFDTIMPFEELEQKIFFQNFGDSGHLDLCDLTGAAADAVLGLQVVMKARKTDTDTTEIFTVNERFINWDAVEFIDGRHGAGIRIYLKGLKGPFGDGKVIIDMSRDTFNKKIANARSSGMSAIDLRPGSYGNMPMPPR